MADITVRRKTAGSYEFEFDATGLFPADARIAREFTWVFQKNGRTIDKLEKAGSTTSYSLPGDGTYEIDLYVQELDGDGNTREQHVRRLLLINDKTQDVLPDIRIEASATSGRAPLEVRIVARTEPSAAAGLTFEWFVADALVAKGDSFVHTFDEDGKHVVKLTVTASSGSSAEFLIPVHVSGGSGMADKPIVFSDLKEREEAARDTLRRRQYDLEASQKKAPNEKLPPRLEDELYTITNKLKSKDVVDPLFVALRNSLIDICECDWERERRNPNLFQHEDGKLPTQLANPPEQLEGREIVLISIYGILERNANTSPKLSDSGQPDARFKQDVSVAHGEFVANIDLYKAVLTKLAQAGEKGDGYYARGDHIAAVIRTLKAEGVTADSDRLGMRIDFALARVDGATDGAPLSSVDIDLPDLEDQTDVDIVGDNIKALQALYFVASLEELKVFQVVDRLVEMFQHGYLPLGRGTAGDRLYRYWKDSFDRLSELERKSLYSRCFGLPGGVPNQGSPNREFESVWMRFISAVSSFSRQFEVNNLLTQRIPVGVSQEQLRKSGRDLAANLSLHGYGIAHFAAADLQKQIKEIIDILSDSEVKLSFGARDMWQVVDQVASLELGGAKNSIRYRTMAESGAVIMRWLADKQSRLTRIGSVVIDPQAVRDFNPRATGEKASTNPTDYDLVNACEQWLAVNGIPDQEIESFAQPIESPFVTSRPVQVPGGMMDQVRDAVDSVGLPMGLAGRMNGGYGADGYAKKENGNGPVYGHRN